MSAKSEFQDMMEVLLQIDLAQNSSRNIQSTWDIYQTVLLNERSENGVISVFRKLAGGQYVGKP